MRIFNLFVVLIFCFMPSIGGQALAGAQKSEMLKRTEELLDAIENGVLTDLKKEEDELRTEAANAKGQSMGESDHEAKVKAQDDAMRAKAQALASKIDLWATSGEEYLNQLDSQELNVAMAEARAIARYFGLDVKKLGDLYELGKQTIKDHEFVLPDKMPPDKDDSYEAYFESFFVFAHERELELSEYREKQQQWRLTLFKRVTLAYIRALLAATEPVPPCKAAEAKQAITLNGQSLSSFGCKDPVVESLRAYVQAVQKIAAADADRFSAEAEVVLAQQELVTDLSAGLPLVGDAMDYYDLYAGQDLAGRCLTRLDYGLTSIFAAIPFMPSGWATQAVKRMGMEKHVSSLFMLMADSATWSQDMVAGVAKSLGITAEHFASLQSKIDVAKQIAMIEISVSGTPKSADWIPAASKKFGISEDSLESAWETLNKEITLPGGEIDIGVDNIVSSSAARGMAEDMDADAVYLRNLEIAADADQVLKKMPPEILDMMRKRSQSFLDHNLLDIPMNRAALNGNYDEVIEASNMLPEHVKAFMELAEEEKRVFLFRYVNPTATAKYADGSAMTKGMGVKGKSATDGVQASFIPVDQQFSKLTDADEIVKYTGKVKECIDSGVCKDMHLVLDNGDVGYIWKTPKGETTIVKRGDKFVDFETGKALDVKPDDVRPLMVLAEYNPKTGKLMPLTADYDLLAVGSTEGIDVPHMDKNDIEGMRNAVESDSIGKLNDAAEESTGHEGIKLVHHGSEIQNPATPGSFDKDPLVTLIDPKYGALNIPKCDYDCMVKWCKSPHSPCGAMPVCAPTDPKGPCIQVDVERLLKDLMHNRRINGFNDLRPNSKWDWGAPNGISGWSPKILMEDGSTAQYAVKIGMEKTSAPSGLFGKIVNRSAKDNALKAIEYLFTCPPDTAGGAQ